MQIYNLTKPELDELRGLCNFTREELTYFNARAKSDSNTMIGMENYWSESKVNALSRNVRKKIKRIKKEF